MLSVVIATENAERVLAPTLAALVPGATAGIVREVIVADAGSSDATAMIADAAGCRIDVMVAPLGHRLRQAAAGARAPWLMFLRPGAVPDWTWVEETRRFIEQAELRGRADARAAAFRRPAGDTPRQPSPRARAHVAASARSRVRSRDC
jgi:glycosyltransferase involved in cell wall biosynthesis